MILPKMLQSFQDNDLRPACRSRKRFLHGCAEKVCKALNPIIAEGCTPSAINARVSCPAPQQASTIRLSLSKYRTANVAICCAVRSGVRYCDKYSPGASDTHTAHRMTSCRPRNGTAVRRAAEGNRKSLPAYRAILLPVFVVAVHQRIARCNFFRGFTLCKSYYSINSDSRVEGEVRTSEL